MQKTMRWVVVDGARMYESLYEFLILLPDFIRNMRKKYSEDENFITYWTFEA